MRTQTTRKARFTEIYGDKSFVFGGVYSPRLVMGLTELRVNGVEDHGVYSYDPRICKMKK